MAEPCVVIQTVWLLAPCHLGGEQALLGAAFAAPFVTRWPALDQRGGSIPHGGQRGLLRGAHLQFLINTMKGEVDISPFFLQCFNLEWLLVGQPPAYYE